MSLQLLEQCRVLVQAHERLAEAGGQHENAWAAGALHLHELAQLFTDHAQPAGREKRPPLELRRAAPLPQSHQDYEVPRGVPDGSEATAVTAQHVLVISKHQRGDPHTAHVLALSLSKTTCA